MKTDKVLLYIGLAMKAGRLSSGKMMAEKSIKEKKARIVVIAEDASLNTKKKVLDICSYYGVQAIVKMSRDELGRITGKGCISCVAVNDEGFANVIKGCIDR